MQLFLNALSNLNRVKEQQYANFPFKSLKCNNSIQTFSFIIFRGGINYRLIFSHFKMLFCLENIKSKTKLNQQKPLNPTPLI